MSVGARKTPIGKKEMFLGVSPGNGNGGNGKNNDEIKKKTAALFSRMADKTLSETERLKIRNEIIVLNQGLVLKALPRRRSYAGRLYDKDDLFQEGIIALMETVKRFDTGMGTALGTYAGWWLWQAMNAFMRENAGLVRLPPLVHEALGHIVEAAWQLRGELGREPTNDELAEKLGWSLSKLEKFREIFNISLPAFSVDDTTDDHDDGAFFSPLLVMGTARFLVEERIAEEELGQEIEAVFESAGLSPAMESTLRQYVYADNDATMEGVGKEIGGVSKERVRQRILWALLALRAPKHLKVLADFTEGLPGLCAFFTELQERKITPAIKEKIREIILSEPEAIGCLPKQQAFILEKFFGLDGGPAEPVWQIVGMLHKEQGMIFISLTTALERLSAGVQEKILGILRKEVKLF